MVARDRNKAGGMGVTSQGLHEGPFVVMEQFCILTVIVFT